MPRLGVNIDHVATLRQQRHTVYPSPFAAALIAQEAGADQITVHLREDRRHIQDADVFELRKKIKIKLNLEMAATDEMVAIALQVRPDLVTLVPEKRLELTTEGGLNLKQNFDFLKKQIHLLQQAGLPVSLFINPDVEDLQLSIDLGVGAVELHTGQYADAETEAAQKKEFERLKQASQFGEKIGLKIYAGHGLHYENTSKLLSIPEIIEYNIGHSIVARAVMVGFAQAVREMKTLLK
ncbi:MAG: pyridoxine 5'-phosphate synthase [Deltaproteobacteria bacterium]|nr:pyridoxine 5'-phosphate synthase [Deltaproteobacteria bacterium]